MKCSRCGAEFEGKFCSNCGAALEPAEIIRNSVKKPWVKQLNKICLIIIAICIALIVGVQAIASNSKTVVAAESPTADKYLIFFSQDTVKKHLKVPSSAQFPDRDSTAYKVKYNISDKNYTVAGYVESKNALGTMIKSYYSVKMEYLYDTKQYHEIQTEIE